jgi:hypothetical protein
MSPRLVGTMLLQFNGLAFFLELLGFVALLSGLNRALAMHLTVEEKNCRMCEALFEKYRELW